MRGSHERGACSYPSPVSIELRSIDPPSPTRGEGKAETTDQGVIEIGEKSTNQLFGCTKPLILGLSARGPTSWATYRNAASSTEAACNSASALSRSAGSKVWRAFVTSSSNFGLLMNPQL